jgi:hypothetical protein
MRMAKAKNSRNFSGSGRGAGPGREEAETLGLQALAFLVEENDRINRFLQLTGVDAGDLARLAPQPSFLLAVLDHLSGDEALLLEFSRQSNVEPEAIAHARRALGGGNQT